MSTPEFDRLLARLLDDDISPSELDLLAEHVRENPEAACEMRKHLRLAEMLAGEYGTTYDHILLAWLAVHPARFIPVLGTTRIARIKAAVDAMSIPLTREQWHMILRAKMGADVP